MTANMHVLSISDRINTTIAKAVAHLQQGQEREGYWADCFDTGVMPDAQTVISLALLGVADADWIRPLVHRILKMQRSDGSWGVYPADNGDLSTTVECYYALDLTRMWGDKSEARARAKRFILAHGGLGKCRNLTKVFLAVGGEVPWSWLPSPSVYSLMFSNRSPVAIRDIVTFTRLHIAPMLILSAHRFVAPVAVEPVLRDCIPDAFIPSRERQSNCLNSLTLRRRLTDCVEWMLAEREEDGTVAGYHSSTFLMLFALLSLGMDVEHPDIQAALRTMQRNVHVMGGDLNDAHQQTCNGHVWNTALAMKALQHTGLAINDPTLIRAREYLLSVQHRTTGEWVLKNPVPPGGWAFSSNNTKHPDTDDTVACLEALFPYRAECQSAWQRGVDWLLGMQNRDGGWSAFEKDSTKWWLEWLPANDMKRAMYDPSTPDITGRVIEFLCRAQVLTPFDPVVIKAVKWLVKQQEADGSWFGRWGTTYVYGTWCAIRALVAAKCTAGRSLRRGREWLLTIQNADGGFGESCRSDIDGRFIGAKSAPSQTAWGLDALLSLLEVEQSELDRHRLLRAARRAAEWLMHEARDGIWHEEMPTGSAFPGALHIRYHIYPKIWPLLALSHYSEVMQSIERR